MLHRRDEAVALLREWTAEDRDDPMPYAILADFLGHPATEAERPGHGAAAIALLDQ